MKDQYFGDVNDYIKYGLLRLLTDQGRIPLCISWMLTPPDGRTDGQKTAFLDQPARWRHYDPELFDFLLRLVRVENRRQVRALEESPLFPRAQFHAAIVPEARVARAEWFEGFLAQTRGAGLVFLDPDIGVEIPSCRMGRKRSSMYVAWSELEATYRAGMDLLVYQHFRREDRGAFIEGMRLTLKERLGGACVVALKTANVVFFLVMPQSRGSCYDAALSAVADRWRGQVQVIGVG